MAVVALLGAELGSFEGNQGTGSIVTSPVRSGNYSYRINPTTTGFGWFEPVNNSDSALVTGGKWFIAFAFRIATLPASSDEIIFTDATTYELRVTSAGILKLYGTVASPTLKATGTFVIALNTWYVIQLSWDVQTTTSNIKVVIAPDDGSTPTTDISFSEAITANTGPLLRFGKS